VVVENRAGGDTIIGSTVVANAAPDGYTLLYAATTHVIIPLLHKNLPFNACAISRRSQPSPPTKNCWWFIPAYRQTICRSLLLMPKPTLASSTLP
jgi:hypothetical protein